jgi:hypothetical protein
MSHHDWYVYPILLQVQDIKSSVAPFTPIPAKPSIPQEMLAQYFRACRSFIAE